jgi:phage tail-like protein
MIHVPGTFLGSAGRLEDSNEDVDLVPQRLAGGLQTGPAHGLHLALERQVVEVLLFGDVTLGRRATQGRDLFDWFQGVAITSSGLGLTDVNKKRNLDIVQQGRYGTTLRRWSLARAWPVNFVAGDWGNEADEHVIESVMLTYDSFELVQYEPSRAQLPAAPWSNSWRNPGLKQVVKGRPRHDWEPDAPAVDHLDATTER